METNSKSFKKFKKTPLFLALAFLAVSVFVFFWLLHKINENKRLSAEARLEWLNEETRRYEIKSLDILLKDAEKEREELDAHFAQSSNIVPFLDSTQELAKKAGAASEIVSVDALKEDGELAVVMRAAGSFESVYKFLELLENSPYELEFATVDLKKTNEANSAKWEAFFKIKLLSFIP